LANLIKYFLAQRQPWGNQCDCEFNPERVRQWANAFTVSPYFIS
jgi:hypothetical protein